MIADWGPIMKALGQPMRMKIVLLLAKQEHCVCELERIFPTSQSAISQHLRILKAVGLVNERREGQWTYYSLKKADIKETLAAFSEALDDPVSLVGDMAPEWASEAALVGVPSAPERL